MSPSPPLKCPAPRSSLACESCRAKKARCLPSKKEGICQRCMVNRSACIFGSRKVPDRSAVQKKSQTRRQQYKSSDSRSTTTSPQGVQEEDVISDLIKPALPASFMDDSIHALQEMHRRALQQFSFFPSLQPNMSPLSQAESPPSRPQTSGMGKEPKKLAPDKIITKPQAEKFLQKFEGMTKFFPFVVLPQEWTLSKLLRDHPFMSLGIFSAMSVSQPLLSRRMDEEFRKVLSEKVIVQCQKSLDILQGLLVYLAWYPVHINPHNRQVYQMIQMAVAIVEDLEIDSHRPRINPSDILAAKRAYLGVFYLSSAIATHKRKNKMDFTPYMDAVAGDLSQNPECETDKFLVPLFRLQACNDEIAKLNLGHSAYQHLPSSLLDASFQSCQRQIQTVSTMLSPEASTNVSVIFTQRIATMNMYALFISTPALSPTILSSTHSPPPHIVSLCIQATKDVFEAIISMDATEYRGFTMVEWCRIIQATINVFVLLTKVPMLMDVDPTAVQEVTQFGRYLEILCFRMGELSSVQKGTDDAPDVFCLWESVLRIVHDKYMSLAKEVGHTKITVTTALCPIMSGGLRSSDYWAAWQRSSDIADEEGLSMGCRGIGPSLAMPSAGMSAGVGGGLGKADTASGYADSPASEQQFESWADGLLVDVAGMTDFPLTSST